MAGNICGNCAHFKPKAGEKFFNCTSARQGGIAYGMQVRADTRACEAFATLPNPAAPKPAPTDETKQKPVAKSPPGVIPGAAPKAVQKSPAKSLEERQRPRGLCAWGRTVLIVVVVIAVALVSWGIYACTSSTGGGGGTPTPTSPGATPTLEYFQLGQLAETPEQMRYVVTAIRTFSYQTKLGEYGPLVQAPVGLVFIIVDTAITNLGSTPISVNPGYFTLRDSEGRRYTYSDYQGTGPFPAVTLSAGQPTASGKILFIIPQTVSGLEVVSVLPGNPPLEAVWKLQW